MLLVSSIFLLPNGTFFAELILFVLVLGIMAKFVLPPIQKTLDERERIVRSSLQAGEEGRAEAAQLAAERGAVLSGARAEARARFDEVARVNEERRTDARRRADEERARIVSEALGRLEQERGQARATVMADVDGLVVDAATRVLGRPVDPSRHRELLEEAAAEASASGGR